MIRQDTASPRSPLLQPFFPALDGLRAIAFLMVFLIHYGTMASGAPLLKWGWVGVDLFFVLSGFLITGILYDSLHRDDFFSNFYVRRALRIFPLYYGFWLLVIVLTPVVHIVWTEYSLSMLVDLGTRGSPHDLLEHPGAVAALAYRSFRHGGALRYIDTSHLWSLCVEEQFYLVWPAVVWLLRRRAALLSVCLGVMATLPLVRLLCLRQYPIALSYNPIYQNTFFRVDSLLFGAAIALWLRGPCPAPAVLRRVAIVAAVGAPLLLGTLYLLFHHGPTWPLDDPMVSSIGFTLVAIAASGVLLLAVDDSTWLSHALRLRPLVFLGRISYGMYFLHGLPTDYFYAKAQDLAPRHLTFLIPLAAFAFTLVGAVLSFRYLESPFLRLKSRLAPRPGAADDPPPDLMLYPPSGSIATD